MTKKNLPSYHEIFGKPLYYLHKNNEFIFASEIKFRSLKDTNIRPNLNKIKILNQVINLFIKIMKLFLKYIFLEYSLMVNSQLKKKKLITKNLI